MGKHTYKPAKGVGALPRRRLHRHIKRQLHKMHMQRLGWHRQWKNWRYKNTTLLLVSLSLFFFLSSTHWLDSSISSLGTSGYIGAFIVGMLFVSIFTVAPAAVVLFHLADTLHPLEIAVIAGAGAMLSDYIIFRKLRGGLFDELAPLFNRLTTHKVTKLFYTPYFAWLLPFIGALIIASPGPDEIGIGLMGVSKIKPWQFLLITFALNSTGIFFVVLLART